MSNTDAPQSHPGNNYPFLDREAAFHVATELEDDLNAIGDFAQVLMDISASDHIDSKQGQGIYRVAMAILHHTEKLSEIHSQLFHGLHADK